MCVCYSVTDTLACPFEDYLNLSCCLSFLILRFLLVVDFLSFSCYVFLMSITQTVFIPADRRLTIEVPREVPSGQVILTFTPKPAVQEPATERAIASEGSPLVQKKERVPGCVKGQVWMAEDFNAPLDDFKDYM